MNGKQARILRKTHTSKKEVVLWKTFSDDLKSALRKSFEEWPKAMNPSFKQLVAFAIR